MSLARSFALLSCLALLALTAAGCAEASSGGTDGSCAGDASCGSCTSDASCKNGQRCDPKSRSCVACLTDAQCPPGEVCGPAHTCGRGCSSVKGCGDAGVCAVDAGACVECGADSDCRDTARPRCDRPTGRCVACLPDKDNCPTAQFCQLQGMTYSCAAGCKDDPDCAVDGGVLSHCDTKQHQCVACKVDDDCPLGKVCKVGACVDGCTNAHLCANALSCCSAMCTDTATDYQNCGACGKSCNNGWNCCNSGCSNPSDDTANCGACGNVCTAPHGVPGCTLRKCVIAACDPGWKDCNGVPADGCEINTDTNVGNCGGCNNPCALPNASPKCVAGKCAVAACALGFGDCDGMPANGCETNIFTSVNNCGGCSIACSLPHATPKCALGACAVGACDAGWADCDGNPNNGCEVDLTTDASHCGACANVCSSANGTPSCVASTCRIACNGGYGDCDGNVGNGCEVNLTNDVAHCGSCGNSCTTLPSHASADACSGAACVVTVCGAGYFDVDGQFANGCECLSDANGAVCGAATGLGQLTPGQSTTASGNVVPAGNDDWFAVTFAGNTSTSYHPKVALTTNPNNAFLFDLFADCGNNPLACGEGGASTGRTSWETFYTGGDPNNGAKFLPIPPVGNGGTVFIRVYRANGPVTCDNFVITISD